MSGAEVAGLVLGAIPLLISGLEYYGEGVLTIQRIRHTSREFTALKLELELEREILINSLEIILKDDVDDRELAELVANIGDVSKWSQPWIDKCLRRRLGRSYANYFTAVRSLQEAIHEFCGLLQIGHDGKGPFDQANKWSVSLGLKRIKFGLKMSSYRELMNKISVCNQRISHLTSQNSTLERIRGTRRKIPDLEKSRRHAHDIFAALQKGLRGTCNAEHHASLCMRPVQRCDFQLTEDLRHRVVLHHEITKPYLTNRHPRSWTVEEAELGLLDDDSDNDSGSATSVRFQSSSRKLPKYSNLKEIQDLCQSLHQLHITRPGYDICLGYLSGVAQRSRHGVFCSNNPFLDRNTVRALSLDSVLDPKNGHKLSESDKRRLALALASGMLQLYDTPWLGKQWGRKEVVLFTCRGFLVAAHPFVTKDMSSMSLPVSAQATGYEYFENCGLITDRTIFALGILLIEIALDKPFEALRGTPPTGDGLADYMSALQLVDQVYRAAGTNYGDAVRRCIRNDFDHWKCSLKDAVFRRKVYSDVVAVLEQDVVNNDAL